MNVTLGSGALFDFRRDFFRLRLRPRLLDLSFSPV